jgi:UDP-N-acetylmuramoyl-L-alanyl-D-glutamate--2,6-diaminopimelate ligase
MLRKIGMQCGLIGTVEIDDGKSRREAQMTTPGACEIARLLREMRDCGCGACAIETSSHALDQHRVSGVRFAAAAFTNLTGDHLDYHKTMESYANAKAKLFEILGEDAVACVNVDDTSSARMIRDTKARVIGWGFASGADYRATDIAITSNGSNFVLCTPDGKAEIRMQLVGRHNIHNALCAATVVGETFGLSVHQIAAGLADAQGAPGRLQPVRAGQQFAVLVDYAHTDDALQNVLQALRPLTRGKLRVLFGCGGDRDRTKRPLMGAVAARLSDLVVLTSDNPRSEDPARIIEEIKRGIVPPVEPGAPRRQGAECVTHVDRRVAIEMAIRAAKPGDLVLIAGKGHEKYQVIGNRTLPFDDVEVARAALGQRRTSSRA